MKMGRPLFAILAIITQLAAAAPGSRHRRDGPAPSIVGGQEATPNEFPFMVSMQKKLTDGSYVHHCGGAVVNQSWVVSASHCVENYKPDMLRIVAGLHRQSTTSGSEQIRDVASLVMHPQYDTVTLENDIVLLKVTTPFDFSTGKVGAVKLIAQGLETPAGTKATVAGWGNLEFNNPNRPDALQKVSLPVVSDKECRQAYGPTDMFDSFICAGVPQGGIDSCDGDSGGPLFTTNSSVFELIGVVSWGIGCASPGYYGVYTEVSYFSDWIASETAAS